MNFSYVKSCRYPAAGDQCESDFLAEYSMFFIPYLCILHSLQAYNLVTFIYIAYNDLLLMKTSGKGVSWDRLKGRYKLISAALFAMVSVLAPTPPYTTSSRCKYCMLLLMTTFPLSGILAHEGMFFVTLFFLQVQGILTKEIHLLIQRMRMITVCTLSVAPAIGFGADLDTVAFLRVQMFCSGLAFLCNFILIELYRNSIKTNVANIKERALLASGNKLGTLPPTDPAMILESKVNFFLSESRKQLPANIILCMSLGVTPVMDKFYLVPLIIPSMFGLGITVVFVVFGKMMQKSKPKSVNPGTAFFTIRLPASRLSVKSKN